MNNIWERNRFFVGIETLNKEEDHVHTLEHGWGVRCLCVSVGSMRCRWHEVSSYKQFLFRSSCGFFKVWMLPSLLYSKSYSTLQNRHIFEWYYCIKGLYYCLSYGKVRCMFDLMLIWCLWLYLKLRYDLIQNFISFGMYMYNIIKWCKFTITVKTRSEKPNHKIWIASFG